MAMLLEHHLHERRMRQKVEISICVPEGAPLAGLGAGVSDMLADQLAHKGIEFRGGCVLAAVEPVAGGKHKALFDGGSARDFDLLVALPPLGVPDVVVGAGVANRAGYIACDGSAMETECRSVFSLGPMTRARSEEDGYPVLSLPLVASQAAAIAHEIAAREYGNKPAAPPGGNARWFMEVGAGAATMLSGDFLRDRARIRAAEPSIVWHWAKSMLEKRWLYQGW
jgi:hypothetical protein